MAAGANAPVFIMHGARAAIAGGLLHIEEQVKALEQAITEKPDYAFDLAKVIVESACKAIIKERAGTFGTEDSLNTLFKAATQTVPFLPPAMAGETGARKSLQQTLTGLNTALQGVCELRNSCGFASHGSEGPRPVMEGIQALLAAQAADAIIGFLYRVHRQDLERPKTVLRYEDNPDFNNWLDEQIGEVNILDHGPYQPSDVLFSVDEEAYRNLLNDYRDESEAETQSGGAEPQEGSA